MLCKLSRSLFSLQTVACLFVLAPPPRTCSVHHLLAELFSRRDMRQEWCGQKFVGMFMLKIGWNALISLRLLCWGADDYKILHSLNCSNKTSKNSQELMKENISGFVHGGGLGDENRSSQWCCPWGRWHQPDNVETHSNTVCWKGWQCLWD